MALLKYLVDRRQRVPIPYDLIAVHLDLGYEDREHKEDLFNYVRGLGLDLHFETTDYAPLAHSRVNRENPCFLCSKLRRKRLFQLAREKKCPKVALGHNRDDLIQTLLLNIFYSGEISTMVPVQPFFNGLLTVIRPLCMVPEDRIQKVVNEWELPVMENNCPSAQSSKRFVIKKLIDQLARENGKVKGNIFRSLSNYRPEYLLTALSFDGNENKVKETDFSETMNDEEP